jgi:adenylate kinase family enzyme
MDGNYSGTLERRVAACDTVILLDVARTVCLWGVTHRGTTRPDMAAGCPEQLTLEFVRWIWSYPSRSRPKVLAVLDAVPGDRRIVRLRSRREMARFLEELPAIAGSR